jgi:two-component system sensor histidine kinase BaeS
MRGRSLAVRLAVVLAGILVIVLLVAGLVVNRAASRSIDETFGPRDQQRLNLAAAIVDQAQERGIGPRAIQELLRRIAAETGGEVRITGPGGDLVGEAGHLPAGAQSDSLSTELARGGTLEIEVRNPTAAFIRAFNTTLIVVGIVAVVAMLAAAAVLSSRLTRPLHEVARAARKLGDGDLSVRAAGGDDAESTELAGAFNEMAARLEHSETLRRRAASDLAHDLATPATVLESQIQAMVDGVVPADAAQLEQARAAASALSAVVGQLGELTQAEAAPLQRRVELVSLTGLMREVVASLESLARDRKVAVELNGEEAEIRVDRGQVARAVRNVVTNAIQHARGAVSIRTASAATMDVSDDGPGIADEDLPFVFERFYRADRARGGRSGSGIGLTVARELIAANGGSIEVASTGPDGTTFRISLPQG